jgi:hypothetical protein
MLCRRCERVVQAHGTMRLWVSRAPAEDSPWRSVLCARCGAVLPPEEMTERLVRKLSQLARFGLGGDTTPLLRSASPFSKDV